MKPMKSLAALLLCTAAAAWAQPPASELVTAAYRDNATELRALIGKGADPNARDERGRTPLTLAIQAESNEAIVVLLAAPGIDVDATNVHDETPLMMAALKGRLDLVRQLYKRRAQLNRPGWAPLHYAASGPDLGVSTWLVQQGADVNARAPDGSTPLMMAAKYGPYDLAAQLLALGADVGARNQQGLSAADFAAAANRDGLQKLLQARVR